MSAKEPPRRKRRAAKERTAPATQPLDPRLREEVVDERLDAVRPNGWNYNEMDEGERARLRASLAKHGWLRSHAALIWGTDEKGVARNLIIDAENRHREATALGMTHAPMVFLHRITEAEARALTVKLRELRGRSNDDRLSTLLRSLPADLLDGTLLGLGDGRLAELTSLDLPVPRYRPAKEQVDLAEVRPHPRNYQGHPEDQLAHLVASLRDYGPWRDLVLARDGTILAGHGLHAAAVKLGYKRLGAVRFPLPPDSPAALKILAIDNELGHFAVRDDRALTEMLREVKASDAEGLLGTGFDEAMLAAFVMVTRPASEVRGFNAAAAWAGMPLYEPTAKVNAVCRLMVGFGSEADRDAFIAQNSLIIHKRLADGAGMEGKLFTTFWPPRARDDINSLRFKEEPEEGRKKLTRGRRRRVQA